VIDETSQGGRDEFEEEVRREEGRQEGRFEERRQGQGTAGPWYGDGDRRADRDAGGAAVLAEHGLEASQVKATGPGGRLLKEDVERHVAAGEVRGRWPGAGRAGQGDGPKPEEVVPMTMLRRRIAQRLVEAQQTQAQLTTFNEIDMSAVMALRKERGEAFQNATASSWASCRSS
jgi:pyruvate/2-oxoglutarate dehydrogenase complex dihydrolipoamide acyltransferase (E2) component